MKNLIKFKVNQRFWEDKEERIFHFPETTDEYTKRVHRYCSLVGDKKTYIRYLKGNRQYDICVRPRMDALSFWDAVHRAVME